MNQKNPLMVRLCAALLSLSCLPSLSAISVWINEFHYDNTGSDVAEFVEIAGTAGTNLAGYSLLLYNGGTGTEYNTIALAGILPNESMGFGTLTFNQPGIQNGPDGLALLGPLDAFIQFLSYEGSFLAVSGGANGEMSENIGVSEPSSTPAGQSLQLLGLGAEYTNFTWSGPNAASPGSINVGQTFLGNAIPDSGTSAALLVLGFSGLIIIKRRMAKIR